MTEGSSHQFDGLVGFSANGGGSGKDGGDAANCALLIGAGIERVETTFGVVSTVLVVCCGGTGGGGGGPLGSGRVTAGGGDCMAHCGNVMTGICFGVPYRYVLLCFLASISW